MHRGLLVHPVAAIWQVRPRLLPPGAAGVALLAPLPLEHIPSAAVSACSRGLLPGVALTCGLRCCRYKLLIAGVIDDPKERKLLTGE